MSRGITLLLVIVAVVFSIFAAIFISLQRGVHQPTGASLLEFDPNEIRVIKIINGDKMFELKKSDDEGWLIGPEPADRAAVDAVKHLIRTAQDTPVVDRISEIEIADRDQLSQYGLKKSNVQFDMNGDHNEPLLIGKEAANEKLNYVRFKNSHDVFLIPNDLVRMVLSPAENYRDRMPVRLHPDRVGRLIIRRPSGEIELKREAESWVMIKPLYAQADESMVETFLGKLFCTRIEGFENSSDPDAFGLAEPLAEIRVFGEGEIDPEIIRVGQGVSGDGYYARLTPRNITVRLPKSLTSLLSVDPTSFRDPSLARINLDFVDVIRMTFADKNFEIRRDDGVWKIGDKRASQAAIQRLVDTFALAKVVRYEPATDAILTEFGLKNPTFSVGFYSVASDNTPEAPAGEHPIGEFYFGRQAGDLPVHVKGSSEVVFTAISFLEAIPTDPAAWVSPEPLVK